MGKKHQGTFTTRPDGRIQYRVMVRGRRITTYGATEAEARAKAEARLALVGDSRKGVQFEQLVAMWIDFGPERHALAPTTFDQYRYLVSSRIIPRIGKQNLETLNERELSDVMRLQEGSPSTLRSLHAAMIHVLQFAVDQRLLTVNAMRNVKRPKSGKVKSREITQDEALRMLKAAKGHRWEAAAWLAFGAGLRRGEILGLRWADLDLEKGLAHIRGNVTRSSVGLTRGEPKTQRGKRHVPLPHQVVAALRAHRKVQASERLAAGSAWVDSGHVITNEIGGIVEPRAYSRTWASWARSAKVNDRGTHVARHFAATALLASGKASVADVAQMLGHNPAVLLSTYAAAVAEGQRSAADALGEALGEAQ